MIQAKSLMSGNLFQKEENFLKYKKGKKLEKNRENVSQIRSKNVEFIIDKHVENVKNYNDCIDNNYSILK